MNIDQPVIVVGSMPKIRSETHSGGNGEAARSMCAAYMTCKPFGGNSLLTETDLRPEYRGEVGALALLRLLNRVQSHSGGSTWPIAAMLRSIHNGSRNPADVELVCKRLEKNDFEDLLETMRFAHTVFERRRAELYQAFVSDETMKELLF